MIGILCILLRNAYKKAVLAAKSCWASQDKLEEPGKHKYFGQYIYVQ
jgi:hypothetical protein